MDCVLFETSRDFCGLRNRAMEAEAPDVSGEEAEASATCREDDSERCNPFLQLRSQINAERSVCGGSGTPCSGVSCLS